MDFKSSLLLIGHPNPQQISLGAEFTSSIKDAINKCVSRSYSVIAFDLAQVSIDDFDELITLLEDQKRETQFVLIKNSGNEQNLKQILGRCQIFRIVDSFTNSHIERVLTDAQEQFAQREQHKQLVQLLNEQNDNLLKLSKDLEERVAKRQQNIARARQKLLATNQKNESLQRTLIALNRAKSIGEMEELIKDALSPAIQMDWTRITLGPQTLALHSAYTQNETTHSVALFQGPDVIGNIHFGRIKEKPFNTEDIDFLAQVAEAVSLALFRLTKLKHFESLKQQWESTFDAIKKPLSLIDHSYTVLRCNKAFAERAKQPPSNVINKKCYEILFGRKSPCKNCHLGNRFRLPKQMVTDKTNATFEVTSQMLSQTTYDRPVYINIYSDITESLSFEYKILSSSKEAELGLIGSSMAHELNNPLGGIINFLQIIKMDLKKDDPYFPDIVQMENAANRCKDIINNLLGFSRVPPISENQNFDLREVIYQSLRIFELKTKSLGIEVHCQIPDEPLLINGNLNLLMQALGHLITVAFNILIEHKRTRRNFIPQINLELTQNEEGYLIEVSTNIQSASVGQSAPAVNLQSIDLQVTSHIIKDHFGQLDITALDHSYKARVKLPRPENQPKSQEIDSQI